MTHLSLREARKAKRWKAVELARRAGLHKATISRLEAGKIKNPGNKTVATLERTLQLRRGTLVFGLLTGRAS